MKYVQNANDILVPEMPQQLDFSESAEAEHGVVKGGDLLNCDASKGRDMLCRAADVANQNRPANGIVVALPNYSVGSFTYGWCKWSKSVANHYIEQEDAPMTSIMR